MDLAELLGEESTPSLNRARDLVQAERELMRDLLDARQAAKLSQQEVGRRMGISQPAVARIESGERDIRLSTLRRYAHAIEANLRHFVFNKEVNDAAAATVRGLERSGLAGTDTDEDGWEPLYRDRLAAHC